MTRDFIIKSQGMRKMDLRQVKDCLCVMARAGAFRAPRARDGSLITFRKIRDFRNYAY